MRDEEAFFFPSRVEGCLLDIQVLHLPVTKVILGWRAPLWSRYRLINYLSQFLSLVPTGSPSRGGDVMVYVFDINQPSLPTPFTLFMCLFLSLWLFQLYFSFHKSSRQMSAFSHCSSSLISALLVLSTTYLFMKVSFSPDIILCGWLGLKHQLNN